MKRNRSAEEVEVEMRYERRDNTTPYVNHGGLSIAEDADTGNSK